MNNQTWLVDYPPVILCTKKLKLMTIAGVMVTGLWKGKLGEFYSAWAPA